ncbi:unnamed protein product [Brassica oleracea]
MLLLVRTPPRLTRSISRRGEELLKSQRSSFSSVSAFSTPSLLPPVRTRLSNVSGPAFLSVTKSPPSLPSKPEPPDLVPREQLEHLFEALSPPYQSLEALSPPDLPLEARSPPEPPDPPDVPVFGNMILCWCVDWSSKCSFPSMIVIVVVAAILVSLSRPLIQLNGVMPHISIHHVNRVLLDRSLMLKIRNTSNTEVLVKGFVAMLKIVDCALAVASILGVISLIVVFNFQGFVSLCSSMVVEIRGLLDVNKAHYCHFRKLHRTFNVSLGESTFWMG